MLRTLGPTVPATHIRPNLAYVRSGLSLLIRALCYCSNLEQEGRRLRPRLLLSGDMARPYLKTNVAQAVEFLGNATGSCFYLHVEVPAQSATAVLLSDSP